MKYLILILLFVSCTSPKPIGGDVVVAPYQTAGVEQFFLAELPGWANGSLSAGCQRNLSVRFMDHQALEKLQGLNFLQRVELQTQFNRKWKERYANRSITLTPQEEAVMFLETMEQVKGGLKDLRFPASGRTHVVWLDSFKQDDFAKAWLENLANSGDPVVLVSFCSDASGIEDWIEEKELADAGFFALGAESMGPYGPTGEMKFGTLMPLDAFFKVETTQLWIKGELPSEFPRGYNVKIVEDPNVRQKR